MRDAFVLKHLPLITPRIEFHPAPPPDLPLLTAHIDFTQDHLRIRYPESPIPHQLSQQYRERSSTPEPPSSVQEHNLSEDVGEQVPWLSLSAPGETSTPTLICEPPGQPGRPGSGGYCLEDVLRQTHGWTKSSIDQFNNIVRAKVNDSALNLTESFKHQDKGEVKNICDLVQKDIPHLARYKDCWPVISALKLILKYRAESSRRAQQKAAAERIRDAATIR